MANKLVLTPGGYKHAEKVHHIAIDHFVQMQGDIAEIHHRTQGLIRQVGPIARRGGSQPLLPLNVSQLRPQERPETARPSSPADKSKTFAEINGWVSYVGWTNNSGQPISKFSTKWRVPKEPVSRGAQTVFLFNGIQNATMIYQPVLQWGPSAAGGGQKWSVACWYADGQEGHSFYSTLVDVKIGDSLTGVMSLSGRNGTFCNYSAEFVSLTNTVLPISNVEELNWANETLEAYGITSREDLPDSRDTDFSSIKLQTGTAAPKLVWAPENAYPGSGSHVEVSSNSPTEGDVKIWYVEK